MHTKNFLHKCKIEGMTDKLINQITKKLAKGKSIAEIADALEETEDIIEKIIKDHNL